jgi:hypothetical protein
LTSLLSLDLGITTGYAFVDGKGSILEHGTIKFVEGEQFAALYRKLEPRHVVAEPPVIVRGSLGDELTWVITSVRSLIPSVVEVPPGAWKDSWWAQAKTPRGISQHERDAIRMAWWYLDTRLKTANIRRNVFGPDV